MDSHAARFTDVSAGAERTPLIEHPRGRTEVEAGILRTARKLFDGVVFG